MCITVEKRLVVLKVFVGQQKASPFKNISKNGLAYDIQASRPPS